MPFIALRGRSIGATSATTPPAPPVGSALRQILQQIGDNMLHDVITKGAVDRSVVLRIIDSTDGTPETGVVFNTSGIDLWYRREGAAKTSITEASLSALTDAHADGGFLAVGDGYYRLDLPDAAFATGANYVDFGGTVTGMIVIGGRVKLVNANLEDGVRLGLTALPNAAAEAAGGLYTRGTGAGQINQAANGQIDANTTHAAGNAWGSGAITAASIAADAITAAKIADGAIDAGAFAADAITAAKLASDVGAEIASAVRTELATELGRVDVAVSSRLATAGYTSPPSAATIAAAVWDYLTSAATTVGSLGKLIVDNVNATISSRSTLDAAGVRSAVGLASANLDTQLAAIDDYIDTEVAAIKAKTDALPADPADASDIAAAIAALNDLSAAQVNAEVVDALATDAYGEPTGVPSASVALSAKISYLYMALRNGLTVTSSKKTFLDDGGVGEWSKPLSDDGTTYTEGEGTTP